MFEAAKLLEEGAPFHVVIPSTASQALPPRSSVLHLVLRGCGAGCRHRRTTCCACRGRCCRLRRRCSWSCAGRCRLARPLRCARPPGCRCSPCGAAAPTWPRPTPPPSPSTSGRASSRWCAISPLLPALNRPSLHLEAMHSQACTSVSIKVIFQPV